MERPKPTLIYCAAGNKRFAKIAVDAGYSYGARLPGTVYYPLNFADQDWRKPNRTAYMASLARHKPNMATVLDWERKEQLVEVLDWAEEAAQWVERVLIIPKLLGGIDRLPRSIGGKDIVLAYSVPTKYGGTPVPAWEFAGWPIHLLGGSPQKQAHAYLHLQNCADVVSVDGNYAQKMAVCRCQYFVLQGTAYWARNRWWPTLQELPAGHVGVDAPYEAFRRSCKSIKEMWANL